jgi:hypothetical protein
VFGDDDAALEIQFLAQGTLPQPDRNGIGKWGEFIEENNLCFDATKLPAELVGFRNFNAGNS